MANHSLRLKYILKYSYDSIGAKYCGMTNACSLVVFIKRYSSALFIAGKDRCKVYAFITPYFDFTKRFMDLDKLQQQLTLRRVNMDAKKLKESWDFYKSIIDNQNSLLSTHEELNSQVTQLKEKSTLSEEDKLEMNKLLTQLKLIREELKEIKSTRWDVDEVIVPEILKLPNEIDERTPPTQPVVLKCVGKPCESLITDRKGHVEIGTALDLLQYQNPIHYYLYNDAALFELGAMNFAAKIFYEEKMLRIAGADFSRSVIIEGVGLNHEDPADSFMLDCKMEDERNRLHLVGGASLMSFLVLHAKQLINPKDFPLKYFTTGRQYVPFRNGAPQFGLFSVCQASVVQAFIAVKDLKNYEIQFEKLLETTCKLYDNICNHYQVVIKPATQLQSAESMRVSFEMWSPFAKEYVEIGHISTYTDYLSKRLLIAYQTPNGRDYPFLISGTVLSVPRLLGCLLEENPNEFIIPPKIIEHMPIDRT